jgi:hypothetical protein
MEWGLTQTQKWTSNRSIAAAVPPVPVSLAPEVLQQVQYAAAAHGVSMATWLRNALHQIAPDDFPASWRARKTARRSHESGYYFRKYQLHMDEVSSAKLAQLEQYFDTSAAESIRQLIAQAALKAFPQGWQLAVEGRSNGRRGETHEQAHRGT